MVEADKRLVEEFMRDLDTKIAEEQEKASADIAHMRSRIESLEDDMRDRWRRCQQMIEPMRRQREAIAKQIAAAQGASHLPVIFIPTNQT